MQKIKDEMRRSGVSYGLSEICDTLSANSQRHNLVIRFAEEEEGRRFAKTKVDQKVFSSAEKAVEHLFAKHSSKVFASEVERETKPSGAFSYLYECPVTKILLPPNSYHDHEEIVRQHLLLNGMTTDYKSYAARLVKVDDADRMTEWAQNTLRLYRFCIVGSESVWYKGVEQLRKACVHDPPASLLELVDSVKISGDDLSLLEPEIADQFERFFRQKSNWLNGLFSACLGNLKKSNFVIFKYFEKKRTFASAFRRKKARDAPLSKTSEMIVAAMRKGTESTKAALLNHEDLGEIDKKSLLIELRWLTREGYVTEFSNGVLILN